MAYLNVRERRIEARIAYVGPDLAGKTTNLEHLRTATRDARIARVEAPQVGGGDVLSVAWRPPENARFRDCEVIVRVIAQGRSPSGSRRLGEVLHEVDGVIVVADAHPAARPRNHASLIELREALARSERASVPLVVQVNKTDLPDAIPAADVVRTMDAGPLPHVEASALRGDGVVDTLELALVQVLASMQREGDPTDAAHAARGAARLGGGATDTGHPLLAALRQVLRETVQDHAAEVEARIAARLATREDVAQIAARLDQIVRELQTQRKSWLT